MRVRVMTALSALAICATLGAAPASFIGKVTDANCGAKHSMKGLSEAECTRACVKNGTPYAIVVRDKAGKDVVYTLSGEDKAALAELDKLAGKNAKVSGTLTGTTITVTKVEAAK